MGTRVGQQKQKSLLLEDVAEELYNSEQMRKASRTNLAQANDAQELIYDFIFKPAIRDRHPLAGRHRQVVAISHNADGDGASGDANEHGIAALGAMCSEDIRKYVHFSFERVMRLTSNPTDPESVQQIVARAENIPTLYLLSDIGSSELDAIREHMGHAVVMDHHPLRGRPGKHVAVVNPYRQKMEGDQISGGGETFFTFYYLMRNVLRNNPFRLSKTVRKQIRLLERSLLLTTLGGSSADNIGCEGYNVLLYRHAFNLGLIERCDIGGFGQSMKDVAQMVGQTMAFVNAQYPVNRRRPFRKALSYSIKRKGDGSLSPQEQEIADMLYADFRPYFMLQFNESERGHYSGLNTEQLFFNMQNIQHLDNNPENDEVEKINAALNELGVKGKPLERIVEEDAQGKKDRVVVSRDSPIVEGNFHHYTEDNSRGNMEKRVKILTDRFPVMIEDLLNEMRNLEGKFPHVSNIQRQKPQKGRKPDYKPKPRAANLHKDELGVIKRVCHELVDQYGDPFRRDEQHKLIEGPNWLIKNRADIPEAYQGKTVAEVGNMLTAFSKLRQREAFLKALPWTGAPQKQDVVTLSHIHTIYRRIIAVCSTKFEQLVEEITEPWGDGIYYVPLEKVMRAKNDVANWCYKENDHFGAQLVKAMPDTAMNGVILGVGLEAGLFPEIYAMVFGSLPIDMEGVEGHKTSVRVHSAAEDKFSGHMGYILYEVTSRGGGHARAASAVYPAADKDEILAKVTQQVTVNNYEEEQLLRRIPESRRPIPFGGS